MLSFFCSDNTAFLPGREGQHRGQGKDAASDGDGSVSSDGSGSDSDVGAGPAEIQRGAARQRVTKGKRKDARDWTSARRVASKLTEFPGSKRGGLRIEASGIGDTTAAAGGGAKLTRAINGLLSAAGFVGNTDKSGLVVTSERRLSIVDKSVSSFAQIASQCGTSDERGTAAQNLLNELGNSITQHGLAREHARRGGFLLRAAQRLRVPGFKLPAGSRRILRASEDPRRSAGERVGGLDESAGGSERPYAFRFKVNEFEASQGGNALYGCTPIYEDRRWFFEKCLPGEASLQGTGQAEAMYTAPTTMREVRGSRSYGGHDCFAVRATCPTGFVAKGQETYTTILCVGSFAECCAAYELYVTILRIGKSMAEDYKNGQLLYLEELGYRNEGSIYKRRHNDFSSVLTSAARSRQGEFEVHASNALVYDSAYRFLKAYENIRGHFCHLVRERKTAGGVMPPLDDNLRNEILKYGRWGDKAYVKFRAGAINVVRARHFYRRARCGESCHDSFDYRFVIYPSIAYGMEADYSTIGIPGELGQ